MKGSLFFFLNYIQISMLFLYFFFKWNMFILKWFSSLFSHPSGQLGIVVTM